ncbi:MAG: hypothetical protein HQK68_12410, partial [Desulfamplus sp.]|nr:hypothetical protein [Desulfamplus sp.]
MKKSQLNNIVKLTLSIYLGLILLTQSIVSASSTEDTTWEVYTNTSDARSIALSQDGSTIWVGTWAGLEERDAQTGKIKRLYTKLDGLPQNSISSVATDGAEGVWVGTDGSGVGYLQSGVCQIFNSSNSDLPFNNISCLIADDNGGVWIGTEGLGLAHLKSDKATWDIFNDVDSYKLGSKLPDNYISSLLSDGAGGIWIGTENGLAHRKSDGNWEIFDKKDSGKNGSRLPDNYIVSLLNDESGGLWIGTQFGGLAHLKSDKSWDIFDKVDSDKNGSKLPDNHITALLNDEAKGLWIGTWEHGLVHWKSDGSWVFFNESDNLNSIFTKSNNSLPDNNIRCLLSNTQGGVWVGTYGGGVAYLKNVANSSWEIFDSGLPGNEISSLLSDSNSGVWIGTERGLGYLKADGSWLLFNAENSDISETITSLANSGSGAVWVGTRAGRGQVGGLFNVNLDGNVESFYKESSNLPDNEITALLNIENSGGSKIDGLWVGTISRGLAHLKSDGSWQIFDKEDSYNLGSKLPDNEVTALLYNSSSNGIWIGTAKGGVAHLKSDGSWQIFDKEDSGKNSSKLPDNSVTALLSDKTGGVWIATLTGGVAHLKSDGSWDIFNKSDSGKNGSKLPSDNVVSLADDGDNGLWIGSWDFGVAHLKSDNSWDIFDVTNSGLPDNHVKALLANSNYALWVGTQNGLAHLTLNKKEEIIENSDIKKEEKEEIKEGKRAAIVIAAGSTSLKENKFWYSTEYLTSQFIYSAFYERGYDHSEIYYLSPKSWANFNSDGRNDYIVDAPVTSEDNGNGVKERDLESDDVAKAFEWAKSKGKLTQPLYLYFVDHGDQGKLLLTDFEALTGDSLSSMIADYQSSTGNTVVVIIEACYSGSMIPYLSGDNRIIITSSGADQESYYDQNGDISFTAAFLMNIDGSNLKDALSYAKDTMVNNFSIPTATPMLDDNGDGVADDDFDGSFAAKFGINGTWGKQDANIAIEAIGSDRAVTTGDHSTFEVKVRSTGAVKSVWAVVRLPYPQVVYDDFGTPMAQNPTFTLSFASSDPKGYDIYTGNFNQFSCSGDYSITFFAKDYENHLDVSQSIKVTATGGSICSPSQPDDTPLATEVLSSKSIYYQEERLEVQVQNSGKGDYDQYTAIFFPDGKFKFITSKNSFSDALFPLWETSADMSSNPITVIDMKITQEMQRGTYWVYNLLVPAGSDPVVVVNQMPTKWVLGGVSFDLQ